jgi:hypothetical protein
MNELIRNFAAVRPDSEIHALRFKMNGARVTKARWLKTTNPAENAPLFRSSKNRPLKTGGCILL